VQLAAADKRRRDAKPKSGRRRFWQPHELELLVARYPHESTAVLARELGRGIGHVYQRAAKLGLKKTRAYLASPAACRLRRTGGEHPGVAYQFPKGHVPHNKGLRRPGWFRGRMKETQFKKGERRGVAARLWKPIGTERVSKDGYLERKVNDDLPLQARWRAVHLIEWKAAHGPLPKGHAVRFKNGDRRDVRLDNLELITRRELMARNTVHNLPKPVAQVVQLLGALKRQLNRRTKAHGQEQDRRPA
jgi:hypothetical protein